MNYDLTEGNIMGKLLKFAFPIMAGNMLQQLYNIVDTLIVGRYLGEDALAAVGSSYTLMVFVTSIILGLSMGSSAFFSMQYGAKAHDRLEKGIFIAGMSIGAVAVLLNIAVYAGMNGILFFMQVPNEVAPLMREYLLWIFAGIFATFLYNFIASLLRAVGNSIVPLCFLGVSAIVNIILDIVFIRTLGWGVGGAAAATVVSQYLAGTGICFYYYKNYPSLRVRRKNCRFDTAIFKELTGLSALTCLQQSIMNFGILMVQGLVNSFGTVVMAAFAAAVKIDSFAYAPVQDFGNAFSTFVAQNYGAGKEDRIRKGLKDAFFSVFFFCLLISLFVVGFARQLMSLFIAPESVETIAVGVGYLQIEAAFYFGIGLLFLFYGYYRAVHKPGISVILTVVSLGTRVLLAYVLSAVSWIGVKGIWMAVPIGWVLADLVGTWYYIRKRNKGDEMR